MKVIPVVLLLLLSACSAAEQLASVTESPKTDQVSSLSLLPACPSDVRPLVKFSNWGYSGHSYSVQILRDGSFVKHLGRGRYRDPVNNYTTIDTRDLVLLDEQIRAYDWDTFEASIDKYRLSIASPVFFTISSPNRTFHIDTFESLPAFLRDQLADTKTLTPIVACQRLPGQT